MKVIRSVVIFLMVAVTASCGGGDDATSARDTGAPTTEVTIKETTTTMAASFAEASGSVTVEDRQGYEFDLEVELAFEDPEVDVANSPPGRAELLAALRGSVTVENRTPGRNLPSQTVRVSVGYAPADYASVGLRDLDEIGCPNHEGYCPLGGTEVMVSAGVDETATFPLDLAAGSVMDEERARATLELLESERPPLVVVALEHGSSVRNCSGMAVYVKEQFSTDVFELCAGPTPENVQVLAELSGEEIEEDGEQVFTFEAQAGDTVSIELETVSPWDASLTVFAPSGAEVFHGTSSVSSTRHFSQADVDLPESGAYRAVLRPGADSIAKVEAFRITLMT